MSLLVPLLEFNPVGKVIITSRIADWSTAVQPVELDVLVEEDG
jgi:hypothetical protein